MKRKHEKNNPDAAVTPQVKEKRSKKSRAERRAARKAEKNRLLPVHKRPIVCPPDRAGRKLPFRALGVALRMLVVACASTGLIIFLAAALQLNVSGKTVALVSGITTLLCSLFAMGGIPRWLSLVGAAGSVGYLAATASTVFTDVPYSMLALYNATLQRLHDAGYLTYKTFMVGDSAFATSTSMPDLITRGVALLTVVIAAVFAFCLVRRVRILPPAIISTALIVAILTFNIYSNRIPSNLGILLVIVSFAAVLVMANYDRLYRVSDPKRYDTGLSLFGDNARPDAPQIEKGKRPTPEQKKQLRAKKKFDRVTEQSSMAMGGYAAAAMLTVCLLVASPPALLIHDSFNTIDAIDEKMAFARDYVTAVLRGDDKKLDLLEYDADKDNHAPHSSELEQLNFTGKQIFYVQSRMNMNLYLRGWIGTDYRDGGWQAATGETLESYRELFGTEGNPSDELRYNFYYYTNPDMVVADPAVYRESIRNHSTYGFYNLLVAVRRVNSPSSLAYFPTVPDLRLGAFEPGTVDPTELTYVNAYDGIYTGRGFEKNGAATATLTYAPLMTKEEWATNQATLQAKYSIQKELLLASSGLETREDGTVQSYITLNLSEQDDGTTMFMYTYKKNREERIWRFYHKTDSISRSGGAYTVTTEHGTMSIQVQNSRVTGVTWKNKTIRDVDTLFNRYNEKMDVSAQTELMEAIELDRAYSDFVYRTYTQKSDRAFLRELASTIAAQAHKKTEKLVWEEIPDDPETEEDDSDGFYVKTYVDVPVDVSLASVRNASFIEAYTQRDLLVRNVIDYIITEMGCKYTITPDLSGVDPSLDGVENFLRNTKEGYCVQFASAAALLLRELGIPVRYVEGYIATDLKRVSSDGFLYGGYVHDYEAHSWIEVYFDGVGWIQYETTPQYYLDMYGSTGNTGSTVNPSPVLPEESVTTPEEDVTEPDTPEETEEETESETVSDEDKTAAAVTRGGLIGLGVIAILIAVIAALRAVVSRAQDAEYHRQSIAGQILDEEFGKSTAEADRREMALEMADSVTNLLAFYDLAPRPGEFRADYADRLTAVLSTRKAPAGEGVPPLPDLHIVLDALAAEEFGHGMTTVEMKQIAALYLYLHRGLRRHVPLATRLRLRYIKRQI